MSEEGKVKNVLICTLGESPAVITETLDGLRERGIPIHRVVMVTTSSESIVSSEYERDGERRPGKYYELRDHIKGNCPICERYYSEIELDLIQIKGKDIFTPEDSLEMRDILLEYLTRDGKHLTKGEHEAGVTVKKYLSISGGRAHMTALAAIAGLVSKVEMMCSVTVDDDTVKEAEGEYNTRRHNEPDIYVSWHYGKDEEIGGKWREQARFVESPFEELREKILVLGLAEPLQRKRIDQLRAEELLGLEPDMYHLGHECVKQTFKYRDEAKKLEETGQYKCPVELFKEEWESDYKKRFEDKWVFEPIFSEIDNLFSQYSNDFEGLCREFKVKYVELNNQKVRKRIQELSQNFWDFILEARTEAGADKVKVPPKSKRKKWNLCADKTGRLKVALRDLICNAAKFAGEKGDAWINLEEDKLKITNTGTVVDEDAWKKKNNHIELICEKHNLEFEIKPFDNKGTIVTISWNPIKSNDLAVNSTITEWKEESNE